MYNQADIQAIINRQNDNGGPYWSRADGNIYAPYGLATIDTLTVLGEMDVKVNDHPLIAEAVEYILTYQTGNGSFRYAPKSSKLPCLTARIIAALGHLGVKDTRLENSYNWLLNTQCIDGGWRCGTIKMGKSPITDASNPGTTLYVLDAFRFRENCIHDMDQLNQGVDFLLQHWDVRQPIGPCLFGIGSQFLKIEYPFLRYNIFYYIYVLSFYKKALTDDRFREAYTCIFEKTKNGTIAPENPHRAWQQFSFAKKDQVSVPASFRWKEIESNCKLIVTINS